MDDRALEDPTQAIARIDTRQADFEATVLARLARRPVGDTELAYRATPKAGTLFLHGQILQRAEYPALGDFAAANGWPGVTATTITLPDMRGKVIRGVAVGGALGEQVGADSRALTTAQMPSHGHTASTTSDSHSHGGSAASAGSHIHDSGNGSMGSAGGHDQHFPTTQFNAAAGSDLGLSAWNSGGSGRGAHTHFFTFDILSAGAHTHSVTTSSDAHTHTVSVGATGGTTAVDMKQASLGWHIAVWT